MKKLVYTLSLMGALAVGANAGVTKVTPANTDAEGCYLIGSAGQLLGFAEIVNGIPNAENPEEYDTDPQPGICGKLTGNISFIDGTLLNADLTGFKDNLVPEANNWTPMKNFSGKFDGQGYTISGLYYKNTSNEDNQKNAGFFESLSGNAIVKNLRLEDFYMEANENIGGFAAIIKSGANVSIERCTSSGVITSTQNTNSVFAGGFIGILEEGTTDEKTLLTITNSSSEGNVNAGKNVVRGGIVGSPNNNSFITLKNCFVTALVGGKYEQGVTGGKKELFDNNRSVSCLGTGDVCNDKYFCSKDKTSCKEDKTNNPLTFNEVLSRIEKNYEIGLSNVIKEKGFKGVSLEYGTRDDGRKIVIAHITENDASRNDNVLQKLVIPEDFPADSVDFDRPFKGNSSTVMIPFDIAAANVTNYNGNNVLLGSVESISCKNDEVKECEATAANAQSQISAHTPYLVSAFTVDQEMEPIGNIPVGQTIHFHGPVVLKKNNAEDSYKVSVGDGWTLVGTYKTLITTSSEDAASDYEKVSMLGKIFGFVGTAEISDGEGDNKHDFTLGEFARAGHNVRTREMRSYLIYSVPNPSPEPSINGMQRMAALSTEGEVELPSSIPVTFESRPIIPVPAFVDTTVKPTTMVQVIMPSYSDDECDSEEGKCEEEGTAAIAKPFISPLKSNKVDRWQDAMGRSLNGKPTKHGSYFKNGIPVIIK